MIKAKIIADSKNEFGNRITTMIVTMPRYILAEFNTHRMLSRNSASSRAIPFEKLLKSVEENPFIPMAWMKDHKGMQGSEYFIDESKITSLKANWLLARDFAVERAKVLSSFDLTKQIVNRLLEPFMWHTVIVTATEWENFFALRCPKYEYNPDDNESTKVYYRSIKDYKRDVNIRDGSVLEWLKINKGQADIHMMAVAEAMWDAYNESTPKELKAGEWHIPFGDKINGQKFIDEGLAPTDMYEDELNGTDDDSYTTPLKVKVSSMMCARVSYTTIGDEQSEWTYKKYIDKHDEMANSVPLHASPFEHCAKAMNGNGLYSENHSIDWSGNFKGFIQYRKTFQNENITK